MKQTLELGLERDMMTQIILSYSYKESNCRGQCEPRRILNLMD